MCAGYSRALAGRLAAALLCAAAAAGCHMPPLHASNAAREGSAFVSADAANFAAARAEAMATADTYMTVVAQATDELGKKTKRPELAEWAHQQRLATAVASFTNATAPNGFVGLLDMLVLARLKRAALEEHWIPTLLHDEGEPVLAAFRRGEEQVWVAGGKVLSRAQLDELRAIIEQWKRDNPTQYYVSHIRVTDFANSMRIGSNSPQLKIPSSVFGLLYADPLAGLDPVAKEMAEYRALTERIVYLVNRMPVVLTWSIDLSGDRLTSGPQVMQFVESTSRISEATKGLAEAFARMPKDLAAERTAAVEQLDKATTQQVKGAVDQWFAGVAGQREALARDVAAEREAIVRDLAAQETRMRAVVADVRGVVERADEAGRSINTATSQTIGTTEQATRRTITHAAVLALVFVIGTALTLLAYRLAVKRWVFEPGLRH